MFNGPNAPHRPTLIGAVVFILVLLVIYHLLFHRGK